MYFLENRVNVQDCNMKTDPGSFVRAGVWAAGGVIWEWRQPICALG